MTKSGHGYFLCPIFANLPRKKGVVLVNTYGSDNVKIAVFLLSQSVPFAKGFTGYIKVMFGSRI